ncbi:MAG: hypothetical protein ACE5I5_16045 [Candidatus Heimdallarchaeota archaeon]
MSKIVENEKELESVLARVLANTLTQKRPCNLIEVARDIEVLKKEMGSLEEVSKVIGISSDMLRQFLSINQLSPKVRKLVEDRKIDSVTVIHYMRNFNEDDQEVIAKEVIADRLTSGDVRALVSLKNKFPNLNIHKLISRILNSKDIKVYVARFRVLIEPRENTALRKLFEKIVGKDEIISFNVEEQVGTLEVTKIGLKKLREAAKKHNLNLRQFVDSIVQNRTEVSC